MAEDIYFVTQNLKKDKSPAYVIAIETSFMKRRTKLTGDGNVHPSAHCAADGQCTLRQTTQDHQLKVSVETHFEVWLIVHPAPPLGGSSKVNEFSKVNLPHSGQFN